MPDDETIVTGLEEAWDDPTAIKGGMETADVPVASVPARAEPRQADDANHPPVADAADVGGSGVGGDQPSPALTPEAREAVKTLMQLPKDLDNAKLAKLAREIAMDIKTINDVLRVYGLDANQYEFVKDIPFYKQALATELLAWNSSLSTSERIKLQAAAILEDSLPALGGRMSRPNENLTGVVEAAKLFAKIGGLDIQEGKNGGAPGERFNISINIGDAVVKHSSPEPKDVTEASGANTISIDTKG